MNVRTHKSSSTLHLVIDQSDRVAHLVNSGFVAPSPTSNREGAQSDG